MVKHSVYFWLDNSLGEEQLAAFEAGMRALFEIESVVAGQVGRPATTPERPVTNNTFDFALILDFESVEQHNAYQVDPAHDVFVETFSPWFKEVRIFDTEI